jgi:hypothetical protein
MDAIEQTLTADLTRAAEAAETAGMAPPDLGRVRAAADRRRRQRRIRTGALVAAAAVVVAGTVAGLAGRDGAGTEIGNDPTPTTDPPTTTTPPTTSATETTETTTTSTTTTTVTTSTTVPVPPPTPGRVAESIPLRATSIGSFTFGSADAATVRAAITAELGPPLAEVPPFEPPVPPCVPGPMDLDPSWRVASEVVWPGLVAWFAGPDAATLHLVGYRASNRASTSSEDANPTVRMADGPALTDPLETWLAFYGSAMVDRDPGGPTTSGMFDIHLGDGQVLAMEHTPTGETARYWGIVAGVSCEQGG